MDLKCPSCSRPHRTEDHPGAFEILCSCGYSILVPDEKAFHVSVQEDFSVSSSAPVDFTQGTPTALEEADSHLSIQLESPLPNPEPAFAELTPPENLPKEMIYDPFEVQNVSPGFEESRPVADETQNRKAPEAEGLDEKKSPPTERSGQWIVERSQAASMGQFLGNSYKIQLEGLSREALVEISERALQLLKGRPWLETELRRRNILLEKLPDLTELEHVPELIAVEIYLAAFELGGKCRSFIV